MGEILFKLHNSYRQVVAICDKELYGRLIQEDNKQIDLTGDFFKGEEISKEDLKMKLKSVLQRMRHLTLLVKNQLVSLRKLDLL